MFEQGNVAGAKPADPWLSSSAGPEMSCSLRIFQLISCSRQWPPRDLCCGVFHSVKVNWLMCRLSCHILLLHCYKQCYIIQILCFLSGVHRTSLSAIYAQSHSALLSSPHDLKCSGRCFMIIEVVLLKNNSFSAQTMSKVLLLCRLLLKYPVLIPEGVISISFF